YASSELDTHKIQGFRRSLDYPEVAQQYRLIEDDTVSVVVRYQPEEKRINRLLEALLRYPERSRGLLRRLQPYIVGVRATELRRYESEGLALEVLPGLWEWCGKYDPVRGLGVGEGDPTQLVI
ncbi:MAG: CRISPR-associated helicase/endonuclease Cas3, partial [Thermomicrobiales bacterium]